MIVFTRKVGETLSVSHGSIELKVVSITGEKVRLEILAPFEVFIRPQRHVVSEVNETQSERLQGRT